MKKEFLFTVHSVAGLFSGVFILIMSLSGAMLVFHEELDGLQYPEVRAESKLGLLSLDSCHHLIQKKYPGGRINSLTQAENPTKPHVFSINDSSYTYGTQSMQVFVHPQTGEILKIRGSGITQNFMRWIAGLHNSFQFEKTGELLLGIFGSVFLISIISGAVIYRNKIADVLLFKKRVFKKSNLHQIVGVYALVFNLLISITGVWMQRYVFTKEFYAEKMPGRYSLNKTPPIRFSIDTALVCIKKKYPEFIGSVIYFSQSRGGRMAIYGSRTSNHFIHSKKLADVVKLDSVGNISSTAFVTEINDKSRYDIINAQVHYGKYGGLPVKMIYSLFGLSGGLLGITGFLLWVKRKRSERVTKVPFNF